MHLLLSSPLSSDDDFGSVYATPSPANPAPCSLPRRPNPGTHTHTRPAGNGLVVDRAYPGGPCPSVVALWKSSACPSVHPQSGGDLSERSDGRNSTRCLVPTGPGARDHAQPHGTQIGFFGSIGAVQRICCCRWHATQPSTT
jgi:hypothetical protein